MKGFIGRRAVLGLGVGAIVLLAAGVAYATMTAGSSYKAATRYTWTLSGNANNRLCKSNPAITLIDERMTGSQTGDARETGTDQVHVRGVADFSTGAGYLNVELRVSSGTASSNQSDSDSDIEDLQGLVTLSNVTGGSNNEVNGLLAGQASNASATSATAQPGEYPDVVTNITGTPSYTNPTSGQSPTPGVLNSITGVMGGQGRQRGTDDNPGVYIDTSGCRGSRQGR